MALCIVFWSFNTRTSVAQSNVSPGKRVLGITIRNNADYNMIKDAGIGWVRMSMQYPYEDKVGGKLTDNFVKSLEEAKKIRALGLHIMVRGPGAGIKRFDPSANQRVWRPGVPDWAGTIASDSYYEAVEKGCEEMGRETRGIVDMWQVANEMDIDEAAGPLTMQQVERFLLAGARGLRAGNPDLKIGINPTNVTGHGGQLYRDLYQIPNTPFDYAGIDRYFGSWQAGGPQDWVPLIDEVYALTHKPVFINEWGYSSIQGSGVALDRKVGNPICEGQSWKNVWRKEHSPEEQAAYMETALKIFATYPHVGGAFIFAWRDSETCYHCGSKGCPAECGWGIVDSEGKPKAAYYTVKAVAHEYF
jgi:hypothetical protein